MKLVIDMPETEYHNVMRGRWEGNPLASYIETGTPLPKGHGAIKDVSQIEIPMCEDRAYETWVQVAINAAPTIIDADKREWEE